MIIHDIDATNQSIGRIASRVAMLLRGKDTPAFTPHIMPEVRVNVHNLSKASIKGTKATSTVFHRHSGYPGGLHTKTLGQIWEKDPAQVLKHAVRGMLPPNRSRDRYLKHLTISI
jgi:large subunit ribosomal protein L13